MNTTSGRRVSKSPNECESLATACTWSERNGAAVNIAWKWKWKQRPPDLGHLQRVRLRQHEFEYLRATQTLS